MSLRLDRLWNGWRNAYVVGDAVAKPEVGDERSVFARILTSGMDDDETYIIHRGVECFAMLNAFPYTTGHAMVLPYRQVGDLTELTGSETQELWAMVTDLVAAVRRAYRPEGINVGINMGKAAGGSVSEHLHVHVVSRWTGDSNFMTAVAETRTIPEPLGDSLRKLRRAWADKAVS